MDRFWPGSVNKAKFESLIHTEALTQNWTDPKVGIIVSNFCGPDSNVFPCLLKTSRHAEVPELMNDAEEADMRSIQQAMHAVKQGCDYTSKVGTKYAAFMANPDIHLSDFMVATGNMDNAVAKAETYLKQVLKKGTGMKTMDQLRNYKYHHANRSCLDDLPPTSHAIRLHIRRVYFATHQLVSLLSSCEPLDPKEFGFELIGNLLVPSKGNNPIPDDLAIHCTSQICRTQRCPCRASKNPCCTF
ncbi:hypothetical protein SK128_020161 [Halocaridina rubra]|uniref:Uncharacterized protein n=1 Tax=Halocaridina rubra TaxID=373956 RepID=A0AAN9A0P1_HALRR